MAMTRLGALGAALIILVACDDDLDVGSNPSGGGGEGGDAGGGSAGDGGSGGAVGICSLHTECVDAAAGVASRCVDGTCVPMLSEACFEVLGDFENQDSVVWGALVAIDEAEAVSQALELAQEELVQNAIGIPLPNGDARHEPIVVLCDESDLNGAAEQLDALGIQSVLGGSNDAVSLQFATDHAIADGRLYLATVARAAAYASLADEGLAWSVSPNDLQRAPALVPLLSEVEAGALAAGAQAPLKVALVSSTDAESSTVRELVIDELEFNGLSSTQNLANGDFIVLTYADPSSGAPDWASLANEVVAFEPDIVLAIGPGFAGNVVAAIEGALATGPHYLFWSDDANLASVVDTVGANDRARGVLAPEPSISGGDAFASFALRYQAAFGTFPDASGAYYYDAFYLTTYAHAAAYQRGGGSGTDLAQALAGFGSTGVMASVGPSDINASFSSIVAGIAPALFGSSGRLHFDATTGSPEPIVDVWCVNAVGQLQASGQRYDAQTEQVSGAFACP